MTPFQTLDAGMRWKFKICSTRTVWRATAGGEAHGWRSIWVRLADCWVWLRRRLCEVRRAEKGYWHSRGTHVPATLLAGAAKVIETALHMRSQL